MEIGGSRDIMSELPPLFTRGRKTLF